MLMYVFVSVSSVPACTIFPNLLPTDPEAAQHAIKRENYYVPYCYSGNIQGTKTVSSGEALKRKISFLFSFFSLKTNDADL